MHKIVFSGKILPGHDPALVRDKLLSMLGLAPEQAERLFCGKPRILKKDLSAEEAEHYRDHLAKRGIGVDIEPPLKSVSSSPFPTLILDDEPEEAEGEAPKPVLPAAPAIPSPRPAFMPPPRPSAARAPAISPDGASTAEPVEPAMPRVAAKFPSPPPMALIEPMVEEVVCPKCGERQPKRTLCRACSTDMPRFVAAQQEAVAEPRRMGQNDAKSAMSAGGMSARASARETEFAEEGPSWLSLSFEGRFGRLSYLWASVFVWFIMAGGVFTAVKTGSIFLALIVSIVVFVYSVRLMVLRNHDIGWSGWLALISVVPYVNFLYTLVLMFVPGTRGGNQYGPQSPRAGGLAAAAGICCLVFTFGIFSSVYKQAYALMEGSQKGRRAGTSEVTRSATDTSAEVLMYTTATCPACAQARSYMKQNNVAYEERDVESSMEYMREFMERGGKGVPFIFVNGQPMHGFNAERFEALRNKQG